MAADIQKSATLTAQMISEGFTAGAAAVQKAANDTNVAVGGVEATMTRANTSTRLSADGFQAWLAKVDPATRAGQQYSAALAQLEDYQKAGLVTTSDLAIAQTALTTKFEGSSAAVSGLSASTGLLSQAAKIFGVAFGAEQIVSFVENVIKSTAELDHQSKQLGISTDALQAYHAAAIQSGVGADAGDAAIQRFTRSLGDAEEASGKQRKAFQDLGLGAKDLAGGAESSLPHVARALLDIEDASKRASIEVALFGKAGQGTEALLEKWADPDLIQNEKDAGLVLSQSYIDAAESADKAWNEFFEHIKIWTAEAAVGTIGFLTPPTPDKSQNAITGFVNNSARRGQGGTVDPRLYGGQGAAAAGSGLGGSDTKLVTDNSSLGATADPWAKTTSDFQKFIDAQNVALEEQKSKYLDINGKLVESKTLVDAATAVLHDQGDKLDHIASVQQAINTLRSAGKLNEVVDVSSDSTMQALRVEEQADIAASQRHAAEQSVTFEKESQKKVQADINELVKKGLEDVSREDTRDFDKQANENKYLENLQTEVTLAGMLPEERERELALLEFKQKYGDKDLEQQQDKITLLLQERQINQASSQLEQTEQDDFTKWIESTAETGKLNLGTLFDSLWKSWVENEAKIIASDLWKYLIGGGSGAGGGGGLLSGLFSLGGSAGGGGGILSLFSGMFADGGTLPAGTWGIAGENGPEPIFSGASSMSVMPNGAFGSSYVGGDTHVTINADGATPQTVTQLRQIATGVAASMVARAAPGIKAAAVQEISARLHNRGAGKL